MANNRNILTELDNHIKLIDELRAITIKNNETINLRLTKGFHPNGTQAWAANGSGDSVWVAHWNGALMTGGTENNWLSQFRIQKNNK
jgi:hypothetical protein